MSNNHSILDIQGMSTDDLKNERASAELNDVVGSTLSQKYPGYPWGVHCDARSGTVRFWLQLGEHHGRPPFGYVFSVVRDNRIPTIVHKAVRGGGELLERHGLVRGQINVGQVRDLIGSADRFGRVRVDKG